MVAENTGRKIRVVISRILGYSALIVWFMFFGLFENYSYTRPRQYDQAHGRVHPQNNHGFVTYLTDAEDSRLTKLKIAPIVLFLAGILVSPKRLRWRRSHE